MDRISRALGRHYSSKFETHGATSEGVDWGTQEARVELRYRKMLALLADTPLDRPSLLDVGCGFGGLLSYASRNGFSLDYTGIDVAENMVEWARSHVPDGTFLVGDVLEHPFAEDFDYVVCNGVLTQKLDTPGLQMDAYAARLIRRLFELSRSGAAFNIMSTKVNFFAENLYYRNPAEVLAWCMTELTPRVCLDHAYPLYEFTTYLYRPPIDPPQTGPAEETST